MDEERSGEMASEVHGVVTLSRGRGSFSPLLWP